MSSFKKRDLFILLISLLLITLIFIFFIGIDSLAELHKNPKGIFTALAEESKVLVKLYDDKLRSDFFSGFLSVGAFLLSLKTFIVLTMKTSLYDTPEYKKTWEKSFKLDTNIGDSYRGLRELNDCLFNSILTSIIATLSQITIGLISGYIFVAISLFWCIASIIYMAYCLYLVKVNLDAIIPKP